jgi:hypothetical protein
VSGLAARSRYPHHGGLMAKRKRATKKKAKKRATKKRATKRKKK